MKTLRTGLAKRDITPQKPVELCGYGYYLGRVFEGVDDPLYVRSVAFVQDDRRYLPAVALYDRDTYEVRSHTIGYHTTPIIRGESERVVAAACDHAKERMA